MNLRIGDEVLLRGVVTSTVGHKSGTDIGVLLHTTAGRSQGGKSMHFRLDDIVAVEGCTCQGWDIGDEVLTPNNEYGVVFSISADPGDEWPYEVGFVDVGGSDYFAGPELRPYREEDGEPAPVRAPKQPAGPGDVAQAEPAPAPAIDNYQVNDIVEIVDTDSFHHSVRLGDLATVISALDRLGACRIRVQTGDGPMEQIASADTIRRYKKAA